MSAKHAAPSSRLLDRLNIRNTNQQPEAASQHTLEALEHNKQEGLLLAVRARWVALAITAVLLAINIPSYEVIYYYLLLAGLAFIGWLQLRAGKIGMSRWELSLIYADILLMVFAMLYPNPLFDNDWPNATSYQFENFKYFYIFLAAVTLGYSWRTVFAYGIWTTAAWLIGMLAILFLGTTNAELTQQLAAAANGDMKLLELMDPSEVRVWARIEELVVFLIVAAILAVNSFRTNKLLLAQASATRERTNLARHFPPNMVDRLAGSDHPFTEVRAQEVVVMFVDIVGFTRLAETASPSEVVELLRHFHRLVEEAVFNNDGTLDKYLGDGVMVTFGTPETGPEDATNALTCADELIDAMNRFNEQRRQQGNNEIRASVGLHFGSVILGDIGTERRLEYATLGDTVNVASRLEEMTRSLDCQCVVSEPLINAVKQETSDWQDLLNSYTKQQTQQNVRGRGERIDVWTR